ncbi:hypothetical protein ACSBR1_011295 [Camellia fascicularis]
MVQDEFENPGSINVGFGNSISATSSSVFERGRFYEEYFARRNERLKRKKGEIGDEKKKKTVYDLGVKVESANKRDVKGLRKSVLSTPMATMDRRENQRYFLRSSIKENKKPPLPVNSQKSGLGEEEKEKREREEREREREREKARRRSSRVPPPPPIVVAAARRLRRSSARCLRPRASASASASSPPEYYAPSSPSSSSFLLLLLLLLPPSSLIFLLLLQTKTKTKTKIKTASFRV